MKPDFEKAAKQWLVSPRLLERHFDHITQHSSSKNDNFDMMRAVASTVEEENNDFAREYALAYLRNKTLVSDVRDWDGHSLDDFDADRKSQIEKTVPSFVEMFCKSVRLPQAKIYMLGGQPHDLLSPEDKEIFHRLFNERHPHLETAIEIQDIAVRKTPKPKEPQWLLEEEEPDFSGDRREEFRIYKEASEKYWEAKMIANTYLLPYWERWEEENVRNKYEFSSMQSAEERAQYDEWYAEAAKRIRDKPSPDGFPPPAQG